MIFSKILRKISALNGYIQVLAGVQAKEDNLTNVLENVIEKVLLIIFNVSKSQTSGL